MHDWWCSVGADGVWLRVRHSGEACCATRRRAQVEIITALPPDARITVYRVGPMVDLCRGPHVPHSGHFKAVSVTAASRAYWRGDVKNAPLQRVRAHRPHACRRTPALNAWEAAPTPAAPPSPAAGDEPSHSHPPL